MPSVTDVEAAIDLLSHGDGWNHGLSKEVVLNVAGVIGVSKQEIGERKPGARNAGQASETGLTWSTKSKGSARNIGLGVVVSTNLQLNAELKLMMTAQKREAGSQVELSIMVLNVTLALSTHNVVGEIGHAWGGRGAHNFWDTCVVRLGPTDGCNVETRICRCPSIAEPAHTYVNVQHGCRTYRVVVSSCKCISNIGFGTPINTQASS